MKKGWRTLLIAIVTAIFGVVESFDFTTVLNGDNAPWIISALGVVFAFLRTKTNTALGESKPKK